MLAIAIMVLVGFCIVYILLQYLGILTGLNKFLRKKTKDLDNKS